VVKVLLAKKADTNLENADTLETCLHLAAATYRNDEEGETPDVYISRADHVSLLETGWGFMSYRRWNMTWPAGRRSKWDGVCPRCCVVSDSRGCRSGAGKIEYEDLIQDLVKAGAMAFPDRGGLYPDVGEDAVGLVENACREAEKKVRPRSTVHSHGRSCRTHESVKQSAADS
jgi:hypothetical protein